MSGILPILGWILLGVCLGLAGLISVPKLLRRRSRSLGTQIKDLIADHFGPSELDNITISERQFPYRVRADLQRAIDALVRDDYEIFHFCGVAKEYDFEQVGLLDCIAPPEHSPAISVPPQLEDIDIGEADPVRCLQTGLWFLYEGKHRFVVLLSSVARCGVTTGIRCQTGVINTPDGVKISQDFFKKLEDAVHQGKSYRGKILSLEQSEHSYTGESTGIKVHKLHSVERNEVILPKTTLDLLDRNILDFVKRREDLRRMGLATKKGLLFYGPPGTGKTHTIHYLMRALSGHTTLLITAEQIGLLAEYMTLARLLQPSIVIIEDADLIARERSSLGGAFEEVMLNKLLNEMDGLKENADILFVLTTNRPESLERALSSRPGRIDQAIEFPLPGEESRRKLVHLYSAGVEIPEHVIAETVKKAERVSAAFIKELMRRSLQFRLERDDGQAIDSRDIEDALQEMLFAGGSLNLKLLGAEPRE